jgi:regulator of protease activity HflC (stomatin/prohibitin superfamily)
MCGMKIPRQCVQSQSLSVDPITALALFATLVFALALASLRRVPDGQVHTVHRFGRYVRTLPPGFHMVWPLLDRVAARVLLIGHHLELPSRDYGALHTGADLYYQILDPSRCGRALERVDSLVLDEAVAVLEGVANQGAAQDPVFGAEALKKALNERVSGLGLRVIRCSLHPG